MEDIKPIIAKNIVNLRKSTNLTQAELAEKLNYSDKAVSKWERAESIPDITILKKVADMFNVTVDYLLEPDHKNIDDGLKTISRQIKLNRLIITLLSACIVFLIATIVFVGFRLYPFQLRSYSWMIYIYAIPVACIVLLVFNSIWGKRKINFLIISLLLWSALLCVYLSFLPYNIGLIFLIGAPAQVIIVLWANLKLKRK